MTRARAVAALFTLSLIWTIWLFLAGGVDVDLFGLKITSNNPSRPLLLTMVTGLLYLRLTGVRATEGRLVAALGRISTRTYATALVAGAVVTASWYATTAASASDAYGYVSQAELWLHRTPRIAQPWVAELPWPNAEWSAAPMGYRPLEDPNRPGELVPTYAPGLPMLMAMGKLIAGQAGLFAIVPLMAGVLVLATYGIGERLGQPRRGLVAAWLVATSPIVLFFSVVPMSDVVAAALWTASFYFLLGRTNAAAVLAGACAAAAVMVRPNLVFLMPIFALRFNVWKSLRGNPELIRATLFCMASTAGIAATAWVFATLYGSVTTSGYGSLADQFDPVRLLPNLKNYGTWLIDLGLVPALVGTLVSLLPLRAVWRGAPDPFGRWVIALSVAAVWLHYCGYLVFDDNLYLRFLLPTWPFVMLTLAGILGAIASAPIAGARLAVLLVVIVIGVLGVERASRRGAFDMWALDRNSVGAALVVSERTSENAVVFALQHSGSLRYYAGRRTIRYDQIAPEWLDRSVAWLSDRGVTAYALLDDWEIGRLKERFAGQRTVAQLARPEWTYIGLGPVRMFRLSPATTPPADETLVRPAATDLRAWPPAPSMFGAR